jgi:CheY-like chemotaxis protein
VIPDLTEETSDISLVSAEPAQLQQIILNVCNNAAQAMDMPGDIEIEIEVRNLAQALRVGDRELAPGRLTIISISDPGRGMDETTLERIFEPFFTTRADGNGLGLATVRDIVLEYDGAVAVKSAIGVGTRFDIWLPSVSSHEPIAAQHASRPTSRGQGETVLLLETDRARLLRLEEILAALGYEPVGFSKPAEAALACRTARTRFDAALLSLRSGASAALDLATALHDITPSLPIILATPSTRDLGVSQLAASGISELIHYPLTSSELAGALSRCLAASAAPLLQL